MNFKNTFIHSIIKVPKFKIQAPFEQIAQCNLYFHAFTAVSNNNPAQFPYEGWTALQFLYLFFEIRIKKNFWGCIWAWKKLTFLRKKLTTCAALTPTLFTVKEGNCYSADFLRSRERSPAESELSWQMAKM